MSKSVQGKSVTSLPMPDRARLVFTRKVDGVASWLVSHGCGRLAILLWKVTGLW